MWVFCQDGFFSAVQDRFCEKNQLSIRGRCEEDIGKLSSRLAYMGHKTQVLYTPTGDYHYRLLTSKEAWASYLAKEATAIDYPNFKDATTNTDDLRHNAYFDCWQAMFNFQFHKEDNKHKTNMK